MFKPHKAETAELSALRFPAIVQPKVDGVRGCYLNAGFTGRTGKAFKNKTVTNFYSQPDFRGFDGELAYGGLTSEGLCRNTTGLVNSLSYNRNGELPQFMAFDWITPETVHLPYSKRLSLLRAYIETLNPDLQSMIIRIPLERVCNSIAEVEAAHLEYIALGFEGTIIRWVDAPHKNGRCTIRESYYMRIKDFAQDEAMVVQYTEAEENLNEAIWSPLGAMERSSHKANKVGKGMVGALVLQWGDEEIMCATGSMTHEERTDYFENPQKLLGRIVSFSHMPYGAKDKPRFAQFLHFRADEDL